MIGILGALKGVAAAKGIIMAVGMVTVGAMGLYSCKNYSATIEENAANKIQVGLQAKANRILQHRADQFKEWSGQNQSLALAFQQDTMMLQHELVAAEAELAALKNPDPSNLPLCTQCRFEWEAEPATQPAQEAAGGPEHE